MFFGTGRYRAAYRASDDLAGRPEESTTAAPFFQTVCADTLLHITLESDTLITVLQADTQLLRLIIVISIIMLTQDTAGPLIMTLLS